ncbi:PEP-CTERM sorting domain-containing protein [Primorskyibacter sp. S187A]|uniref:PEP-CTERM sorting domain-containing protein n=1 Tax=Primorskyibacter sp. S187A TaxID=3415130 RepID=UPI003C7C4E50
MKRAIFTSAAALAFVGSAAAAGSINFEEFAPDNANGPMQADRYETMGVLFDATDDGSTWEGLGAGDFGNWDLEGTNGSTFMGINGSSYGLTMNFFDTVSSFSLDASRAAGSDAGDALTVTGLLNDAVQDSVTLTFGDINSWSTFSLTGLFDEVTVQGQGQGFGSFGVDNLNWETTTSPVPVPASLPLALLGLGAFGLLRRRAAQA